MKMFTRIYEMGIYFPENFLFGKSVPNPALVPPNTFKSGAKRKLIGFQQQAIVNYVEAHALAAPITEDDDTVADHCVDEVDRRWRTSDPNGIATRVGMETGHRLSLTSLGWILMQWLLTVTNRLRWLPHHNGPFPRVVHRRGFQMVPTISSPLLWVR